VRSKGHRGPSPPLPAMARAAAAHHAKCTRLSMSGGEVGSRGLTGSTGADLVRVKCYMYPTAASSRSSRGQHGDTVHTTRAARLSWPPHQRREQARWWPVASPLSQQYARDGSTFVTLCRSPSTCMLHPHAPRPPDVCRKAHDRPAKLHCARITHWSHRGVCAPHVCTAPPTHPRPTRQVCVCNIECRRVAC
jgi:hypothetical protein